MNKTLQMIKQLFVKLLNIFSQSRGMQYLSKLILRIDDLKEIKLLKSNDEGKSFHTLLHGQRRSICGNRYVQQEYTICSRVHAYQHCDSNGKIVQSRLLDQILFCKLEASRVMLNIANSMDSTFAASDIVVVDWGCILIAVSEK